MHDGPLWTTLFKPQVSVEQEAREVLRRETQGERHARDVIKCWPPVSFSLFLIISREKRCNRGGKGTRDKGSRGADPLSLTLFLG